jgi:hypothetical protein
MAGACRANGGGHRAPGLAMSRDFGATWNERAMQKLVNETWSLPLRACGTACAAANSHISHRASTQPRASCEPG